jgi:hypothetical protein
LVQEILREVFLIEEALGLKGIQSVAGQRLIRRMKQDLRFYFRQVERAIDALELKRLAGIPEAHFIADRMLEPVLIALEPQLNQILISNLEDAFVSGRIFAEKILKRDSEFIEQDSEAYAFASARAATLIKGINDTTRKQMRNAIATGLRDRLGVDGLGRLIRRTVLDMSVFRSNLIANTEMNEAVTQASFSRYKRAGALFKTTVLSIVPCPICIANEGQGPIPMDQNFQSGHPHPPFHPNCACTLIPAREPRES